MAGSRQSMARPADGIGLCLPRQSKKTKDIKRQTTSGEDNAMRIKCDRLDLGPATPPCGCGGWHRPSGGQSRRRFLRGASALGLAAALPAIGTAKAETQPAANIVDVHHHYTSPALLATRNGPRTP